MIVPQVMCLVVFALSTIEGFPFVLAANRDEYFARPSASAAWWEHDGVEIFGGRDLEKGGTWLGLTRAGRIAVVTNVRDVTNPARPSSSSRGWITTGALTSARLPPAIARDPFPSFNLLVAEGDATFYARDDGDTVRVAPGFHGLSNHRLDTPWPKVERAVSALAAMKSPTPDALFDVLADRTLALDDALPKTGVPLEVERALSPAFVNLPAVAYGTRCSTVVMRDRAGVIHFEERTFDASGAITRVVRA